MSDALEEILSGWAREEYLKWNDLQEIKGHDRDDFYSYQACVRSVAEEVVRRCEGMPLPRVHETWPKPYRVGWLDGAAAFGEALRSLFPTAFKEKE